tara:strand:- start:56 stop:250 length:195 start_codon:yes stop_codon:yes gene_type:complete
MARRSIIPQKENINLVFSLATRIRTKYSKLKMVTKNISIPTNIAIVVGAREGSFYGRQSIGCRF